MKTVQPTKQIRIELHFTPVNLDEMALKDKNVVVIDVLRASTSIAMALHNGAKEIIPVNSVEYAVKISGSQAGGMTLRAGERNSKMIEGFNLGNSPAEYTEETVKGKSIIFMTTNGSVAIVKGKHARNLVVAGFVNISPVVDYLVALNEDITIVCAGQEENFCIEDTMCAGRIINMIQDVQRSMLELDDAAVAASVLDKALGKSLLKILKNSEHGKYLAEIGFAQDVKLCSDIDSINVLPVLTGNVIRLQKDIKPKLQK
jgi:2-phosphosulfolactate phosphatase